VVLPFTGLDTPSGVAVDSAGSVYVTNFLDGPVLKLAAGATTPTELTQGLYRSVAADSAGAVYLTHDNRVLKLAPGATTPTELPVTGLGSLGGVAVDSAGNVYLVDKGNQRVVKLPAGANTPTVLPFTGGSAPSGVAVDSAGNVFVTMTVVHVIGQGDTGTNRVLKLAAGATTQIELPFTGLKSPHGVAVDSAGNLYVTDDNRVLKLPAGATTQTELPFTGLKGPDGVAVDSAGNVYVADPSNNRVLKLPTQ
jgi:serine/threonine-protein kinase